MILSFKSFWIVNSIDNFFINHFFFLSNQNFSSSSIIFVSFFTKKKYTESTIGGKFWYRKIQSFKQTRYTHEWYVRSGLTPPARAGPISPQISSVRRVVLAINAFAHAYSHEPFLHPLPLRTNPALSAVSLFRNRCNGMHCWAGRRSVFLIIAGRFRKTKGRLIAPDGEGVAVCVHGVGNYGVWMDIFAICNRLSGDIWYFKRFGI